MHVPKYLLNCRNLRKDYIFPKFSLQKRTFLHESSPKGEYKVKDETTIFRHIQNGWKVLGQELKLWTEEWKEKFDCDVPLNLHPGIPKKIWTLKSAEDLERWVVTSDTDNNEGKSSAQWVISPAGHGLFTGCLDASLPKDGKNKRSGYCSVRNMRPQRSFKRDSFNDWSAYTHLVLRVRGDGRTYMINLATSGYYDILWNDIYHYMLHTRGGPYWQVTKIPFSKFFMSSKGRIQDQQYPIPLNQITNFGITASDKIDGKFSLEIDFIGVEFNPLHTEEFAYEMYRTPRFLVGS